MSSSSLKINSTLCETCPRYSDRLPSAVTVVDMQCTKTNWGHAGGTEQNDRYALVMDREHKYPEYSLVQNGVRVSYLENKYGWWFFHRNLNVVNSAGEVDPPPAVALATSLRPPESGWKEKCNGKWESFSMRLEFDNLDSVEMRTRSISVLGADDVAKCTCQVGMTLLDSICVCGKGKYLDVSTNACVMAPVDHFQQYDHSMSAHPCPDGSTSDAGSKSPDDCKCKAKMSKIKDPEKPDLEKCICDDGYYMLSEVCQKCGYCEPIEGKRRWRKGCSDTSPGTCELCQGCSNPEETRVGCHSRRPGECTLKKYSGMK